MPPCVGRGCPYLAKQVPVRISRGLQTWTWKNLQAANDGRWSHGRLFPHMILFRPWKSCVADFRALDGLHRIGALLMVCMLPHVFRELPMHYYRKSISTIFLLADVETTTSTRLIRDSYITHDASACWAWQEPHRTTFFSCVCGGGGEDESFSMFGNNKRLFVCVWR